MIVIRNISAKDLEVEAVLPGGIPVRTVSGLPRVCVSLCEWLD